jgi:hypothetical protein
MLMTPEPPQSPFSWCLSHLSRGGEHYFHIILRMGNLCSSTDKNQSPGPKSKSSEKVAKDDQDTKKHQGSGKTAASGSTTAKKEKPVLSWQRPSAMPSGFEGRIVAQSRVASDYAAEGLSGETWIRRVGQVTDQRINVDQCTDCTFYVTDQLDSLQVDECKNCVFFIGPTMGSVFVRNCVDCRFVVACGQLRTRDLKRCSFALFCQSRPVVESSKEITIGCYPSGFNYFAMQHHLRKARLSPYNNLYSQVHDFTPHAASPNYSLLDQSQVEGATFAPPLHAIAPDVVTEDEACALVTSACVIPFTLGIARADDAPCFRTILMFSVARGGREAAEDAVRSIELLRRLCDSRPEKEVEIDDIQFGAADDGGSEIPPLSSLASPPKKRGNAKNNATENEETPSDHSMSRVVLVSSLEHLFTAEDAEQLDAAGLAAIIPSATSFSTRSLVGDVVISLYLATDVPKHPTVVTLLENSTQEKLVVRVVDVLEKTDGTSSNLLSNVAEFLFSKLPTQGTGFGAGHK